MTNGIGLVEYLLGAGALAIMGGYVWLRRDQDIQDITKTMQTKASIEMVEELRGDMRESLDKIAEKVDRISDDERTTAVTLAEIRTQMARLVSNAESEKGTRARSDERIERLFFGEIRSLRDSIRGYGRRKSDSPDTE